MKKGSKASNIIKLTENELHALIKENVIKILESKERNNYYNTLHEEYWPGDIDPRALQAVQQDAIKNQINVCYQKIDDCLEEIRGFAKSGNASQVMYYAEQIETYAKFINTFKPEIK